MENDRPAGDKGEIVELSLSIDDKIRQLQRAISFWRPRAFTGHLIIATVGSSISVIAGLRCDGFSHPQWLQKDNMILVLGAIITVTSAWQAFYRHRDRWLNSASAADRLRTLRSKVSILSKRPAPVDGDLIKPLEEEFFAVLADLDRAEISVLTRKEDKDETQAVNHQVQSNAGKPGSA